MINITEFIKCYDNILNKETCENIVKNIITELWVIAYVHLYATPVAIVSFGFIAIMMMFTWILLNGF